MFYYFEERYKKLIFFTVLKLQKIEFMKRFYKQLFYSFKTAKKIAYGNADYIFHNFTATVTATVWKSSFLQF